MHSRNGGSAGEIERALLDDDRKAREVAPPQAEAPRPARSIEELAAMDDDELALAAGAWPGARAVDGG